jgi:hypothetical protein
MKNNCQTVQNGAVEMHRTFSPILKTHAISARSKILWHILWLIQGHDRCGSFIKPKPIVRPHRYALHLDRHQVPDLPPNRFRSGGNKRGDIEDMRS